MLMSENMREDSHGSKNKQLCLWCDTCFACSFDDNSHQFALSESTCGYVAIPNAIADLSSEEVKAGVFFLGFELERLDRTLEEEQMIASKDVKLVFRIPAYHSGWELDAIVPHLPALDPHKLQLDYCSANDLVLAVSRPKCNREIESNSLVSTMLAEDLGWGTKAERPSTSVSKGQFSSGPRWALL